MLRDIYISSAFCAVSAISITAFALQPAYAEFPPEGAVSDPNNPSIASGDLPDPSHKGVLLHYIFYFDCGKRDWIGVSVTNTEASPSSPPQAVGLGRKFPPGPPLGSKIVSGNRAIVAATGQTFVLQSSGWFDVKTKKPMRSPNLCPEGAVPHEHRPTQNATDPERGSERDAAGIGVDKVPPSGPMPKNDQKPDQLPPPPEYLPDHSNSQR
jgi:hypothetical protein